MIPKLEELPREIWDKEGEMKNIISSGAFIEGDSRG